MFEKNIGPRGRTVRFVIGVVLLVLAIWLHSWIVLFFAAFAFFEAFMSWCVVYQFLGKKSCEIDKK